MQKVHLLLSLSPVERGTKQAGLCGAEITKCERVYFWTPLECTRGGFSAAKGLCQKCRKVFDAMPSRNGREYIFGLIEAQAALEPMGEESELWA